LVLWKVLDLTVESLSAVNVETGSHTIFSVLSLNEVSPYPHYQANTIFEERRGLGKRLGNPFNLNLLISMLLIGSICNYILSACCGSTKDKGQSAKDIITKQNATYLIPNQLL